MRPVEVSFYGRVAGFPLPLTTLAKDTCSTQKMAKKKVDDKPPAPPPARRRRGLAGKFDLLVSWATRVAKGKDLTTKDKVSAAILICAAILSSAPP